MHQQLSELARQSNESKKTVIITFIVGLCCLWPVWIFTYLEYTKMQKAKEQVGLMGVDVRWWQTTYGATDLF